MQQPDEVKRVGDLEQFLMLLGRQDGSQEHSL
jgi:hypothetical protein